MSSLDLRDHCTQPEQIRQPTVGSPTREGDERIGLGDIGPRDGHGGQRSVIIGVEDAVLPQVWFTDTTSNVRPVSG